MNQDGTSMFVAPFYLTLSVDAATLDVSDVGTNTVTCLKTGGSVKKRILHEWSFYMKFMKRLFGEFHKFHMT